MSWEHRPWADNPHGGGRSFSDNPLAWAPTIGRVFGIRIRIHILFILFILFEILGAGSTFGILYVSQYLFILFGSVFLHELGHCFAARHVGGRADEVLMWPLGGLAMVDAPRAPWPQFFTIVCGPLVNLALCAVTGLILAFDLVGSGGIPFNPFSGWGATLGTWGNPHAWVQLVFQINWVLFLFNLWPMYPMDGGRMLHSALWWKLGYGRATSIATTVGMIAAVLLGFYGILHQQWLLLIIAFYGYMTCMQERQLLKAGVLAGDFDPALGYSGGYTRLDGPARREGWLSKWKRRRNEARRDAARQQMQSVEEEVDRILAKVHTHGIQSLTPGEKHVLEEATKQQRTGRY